MRKIKESKVMVELEEMRSQRAKEMAGLSVEERVRIYNEEGEKAAKELGLKLPRREKVKT